MESVRSLPLYDPSEQPPSWNERMSQGDYAVHRSDASVCTIHPSLEHAEAYARELVTLFDLATRHPSLSGD